MLRLILRTLIIAVIAAPALPDEVIHVSNFVFDQPMTIEPASPLPPITGCNVSIDASNLNAGRQRA